jgi:hypothetical protein
MFDIANCIVQYLIHFRNRHCRIEENGCHYIDSFLLLVATVGEVSWKVLVE